MRLELGNPHHNWNRQMSIIYYIFDRSRILVRLEYIIPVKKGLITSKWKLEEDLVMCCMKSSVAVNEKIETKQNNTLVPSHNTPPSSYGHNLIPPLPLPHTPLCPISVKVKAGEGKRGEGGSLASGLVGPFTSARSKIVTPMWWHLWSNTHTHTSWTALARKHQWRGG